MSQTKRMQLCSPSNNNSSPSLSGRSSPANVNTNVNLQGDYKDKTGVNALNPFLLSGALKNSSPLQQPLNTNTSPQKRKPVFSFASQDFLSNFSQGVSNSTVSLVNYTDTTNGDCNEPSHKKEKKSESNEGRTSMEAKSDKSEHKTIKKFVDAELPLGLFMSHEVGVCSRAMAEYLLKSGKYQWIVRPGEGRTEEVNGVLCSYGFNIVLSIRLSDGSFLHEPLICTSSEDPTLGPCFIDQHGNNFESFEFLFDYIQEHLYTEPVVVEPLLDRSSSTTTVNTSETPQSRRAKARYLKRQRKCQNAAT
jgi:hypothetical protein